MFNIILTLLNEDIYFIFTFNNKITGDLVDSLVGSHCMERCRSENPLYSMEIGDTLNFKAIK